MLIFQLQLVGILLLLLALIHIIFPRYFAWKQDLQNLKLINKQMMYVHTFFIALVVFLMGLLCLTSAHLLVETVLGKRLLLGLGIFWGMRLLVQFFGYSSQLWKGKTFETSVHIVFSILWLYLTSLFLYAALL